MKARTFRILLLILVWQACSQSSEAFLQKAKELMQAQQYEQALDFANKAIEKDESNAELFNLRGVIYFELKKYPNALLDYERAISLNTKDYRPYFNRAELHRTQGRAAEALRDYDQAVLLSPNTADLYLNRGVLHYEERFFKGIPAKS